MTTNDATTSTGSSHRRDLYTRYDAALRRAAKRLTRRLPSCVDEGDLLQAGWVGALEVENRRSTLGTDDDVYALALRRASGAMLDYLRRNDPLPRRLRKFARVEERTKRAASQALGTAAGPGEIATRMGLSVERYEALRSSAEAVSVVALGSLDQFADAPATRSHTPEALVGAVQDQRRLGAAIESLPERLRTVVNRCCINEESLKSVGNDLGISESRVCQLQRVAIGDLVKFLQVPADNDTYAFELPLGA